jgi:hypothetical protein
VTVGAASRSSRDGAPTGGRRHPLRQFGQADRLAFKREHSQDVELQWRATFDLVLEQTPYPLEDTNRLLQERADITSEHLTDAFTYDLQARPLPA